MVLEGRTERGSKPMLHSSFWIRRLARQLQQITSSVFDTEGEDMGHIAIEANWAGGLLLLGKRAGWSVCSVFPATRGSS